MKKYYVEFSSNEYLAKSEIVYAKSVKEAKIQILEMFGESVKFNRVTAY